jgi:EmrB/QacA subfamily drug resistance transporter
MGGRAVSSQPNPVTAPGSPPAEDDEPQPGRHVVFAIVSLALMMSSVDQTIVATALGAIQDDLHTAVNWSTWTITVYALGRTVVLPVAGRFSDLYGRRRVFLVSVAVFTAASLGCGFANDIYTLVTLRAVQAIGGGALMPAATGIVADQYGRKRDRPLASFTNIFAIGGIIGPVIGGIVVTYWSWRGIFFVNVPIGAVLLVLTYLRVPENRSAGRERLDLGGSVLFGTWLLAVMLLVSTLGSHTTTATAPVITVTCAIAIVTGVLFVRRARRVPNPVIPLRLLRGRGFAVLNTINFLWGAAMLGFGALVPLYAQERFDIPALGAGTLLTARAVGIVVVTGVATFALHRTGFRRPILFGFLIAAVGLVMISLPPHGFSAYTWLAIAAAITGVGMGLALPASNVAALSLAKGEMASVAGLRAMFRQCGGIFGVAVVSAVVVRSGDPGHALAYAFVVFAVVLVALTPLVFRIPEAGSGREAPVTEG